MSKFSPSGSEDFGAILESFEREEDRAIGRKPAERGTLLRKDPAPPTIPRAYGKPVAETADFASALAEFEGEQKELPSRREPAVGDRLAGQILSIDLESAVVDLGGKSSGMVRSDALTDRDGSLLFAAGDRLDFEVIAFDRTAGCFVLRPLGKSGASARAGAFEAGARVYGQVMAVNKGGVEVQVGSKRAFCPFSQLADHRVEDASSFVGQRLEFLVQRSETGRDLVLSRRALLMEARAAAASRVRASLEPGSVVKGRVTALAEYGAFVDLGGLEGLIHVSELSFRRLRHPSELVAIGQEIDVKILHVERTHDGKERVSLSCKALERDPWLEAAYRFPTSTLAHGKVMRLESFGAFVELAPGLEGLLHISELGRGRRINHPREVVKVGQELEVRVGNLDVVKKKISLTMAEAGEAPDVEAAVRDHAAQAKSEGAGFGAMAKFFEKAKKL